MKTVIVMMMGALLVAAAPVKLAPADDKPSVMGAAARHKHGPEPMAKPAEDIGTQEDPAPQPGQSYINQPKPPVEAAPANPK